MANEYVLHAESIEDFDEKIKSGTVLVDFWAAWCGPCRMVAPILDQIAAEKNGEITVVKVDVDALPELAAKFGVMSIPTLLLFKDGEMVNKSIGAMPKPALEKFIAG